MAIKNEHWVAEAGSASSCVAVAQRILRIALSRRVKASHADRVLRSLGRISPAGIVACAAVVLRVAQSPKHFVSGIAPTLGEPLSPAATEHGDEKTVVLTRWAAGAERRGRALVMVIPKDASTSTDSKRRTTLELKSHQVDEDKMTRGWRFGECVNGEVGDPCDRSGGALVGVHESMTRVDGPMTPDRSFSHGRNGMSGGTSTSWALAHYRSKAALEVSRG